LFEHANQQIELPIIQVSKSAFNNSFFNSAVDKGGKSSFFKSSQELPCTFLFDKNLVIGCAA